MENGIDFKIKISLLNEQPFFGHGLAELLLLTEKNKSLRKACEEMGMSYSKGWSIIHRAEKITGFDFLYKKIGGTGGGGSRLTDKGRLFIQAYYDFCNDINNYSKTVFQKYFSEFTKKEEDINEKNI